jgi:aminoglycoside phosphotransferase (APT) family kinase protein
MSAERDARGVDLDPRVLAWLAEEALPGARIVSSTLLSGGFVNENLLLVTDTGRRCVLRRYLRPDGQATCAVETALAQRVRGVVPVAVVVAAEPSGRVVDEPLLLSEFVTGTLASTALIGGEDPGGLGVAMGRALASIGTVAFAAPGFFTGPDLRTSADGMAGGLADFVAECLAKGNADDALSADERRDLVALAKDAQPLVTASAGVSRLVHSDYNPKNVLVDRVSGRWAVTAVLDWEFAFSGHPLADVGNLLRFAVDYPPEFVEGVLAGFREGGGELPADWRATAEALDLFALADLLTRPPDSPLFDKVVAVVRDRLRGWTDHNSQPEHNGSTEHKGRTEQNGTEHNG